MPKLRGCQHCPSFKIILKLQICQAQRTKNGIWHYLRAVLYGCSPTNRILSTVCITIRYTLSELPLHTCALLSIVQCQSAMDPGRKVERRVNWGKVKVIEISVPPRDHASRLFPWEKNEVAREPIFRVIVSKTFSLKLIGRWGNHQMRSAWEVKSYT